MRLLSMAHDVLQAANRRTDGGSGSSLLERSVLDFLSHHDLITSVTPYITTAAPGGEAISHSILLYTLHSSVPIHYLPNFHLICSSIPAKATMAAAVHPHVCTVDIGERPIDETWMSPYHNHEDRSAVDAFPVPRHGLEAQSAANVLSVPHVDPTDPTDPTDPPADNTHPTLQDELGDKSAKDVSTDNARTVVSCDPARWPAGLVVPVSHQSSHHKPAFHASVVPGHGASHHAADDTNPAHRQFAGGQGAENISVGPNQNSEDKPAGNTSKHDPGCQWMKDTVPIPHRHLENQTSVSCPVAPSREAGDEPAGEELEGSHHGPEDQPSPETLVNSCQKPDDLLASETLQPWDSVGGKRPIDDGHFVLFHDIGPKTSGQTFLISHPDSKAELVNVAPVASTNAIRNETKVDSHLVNYHYSKHSPPNDALLTTNEATSDKSAKNTSIALPGNSEQELAGGILISDNAKYEPTKHHLRSTEEEEIVSVTCNGTEKNYRNGHIVPSDASRHLNEDFGNKHANNAPLELSRGPEVQTLEKVSLSPSNYLSDQPADEALLSSSHVSSDQPAEAALSILYQEANYQPTEGELVVSPYTLPSHLLRLHTVSKPNQLLAKALTHMRAVREDYATAAYQESFNWSAIVEALRDLSREEAYDWQPEVFYIVVFRSRVRGVTNRVDLGLMDAKAHEEAMESGGLLKYWFGVPDANCRNLATCKSSKVKYSSCEFRLIAPGIWRNQEDAKRGGRGEGHQRAMRAIAGLYSEWKLERLRFVIEAGKDGELLWDISEW